MKTRQAGVGRSDHRGGDCRGQGAASCAVQQAERLGIVSPDKLIGNFKAVTGGITLAMIFISSIALMVGGVG